MAQEFPAGLIKSYFIEVSPIHLLNQSRVSLSCQSQSLTLFLSNQTKIIKIKLNLYKHQSEKNDPKLQKPSAGKMFLIDYLKFGLCPIF